ncbi:MAG TPA: hypothetical protein VN789_05590 [Casimicrobiaceae bacterium]|nr:hypothetical protein [Casimicrobiaceae bacterium]
MQTAASMTPTSAGVAERRRATGGGMRTAGLPSASALAALRARRRSIVSLARRTSGSSTDEGSLRARFNAERHAAQSFAPVSTGVPQNSQFTPATPAAGLPAMSIAPIVLENEIVGLL